MENIRDINIKDYSTITPPKVVIDERPISETSENIVSDSRKIISDIVHGKDNRILLIVHAQYMM